MKFNTLCILILGLAVFSCKKKSSCYQGSNNITTETRSVDNFHHVDLSTSANVYIQQGSNYHVIVETSDNLQDIVQTEVNNGLLSVSSKKDKCIHELETLNVYITAPDLSKVSISGAGSIYMPNKFVSDDFIVWSSGSGSIIIDSLQTDELSTNISGSGEAYVSCTDTLTNIDIWSSGSGQVDLRNAPTFSAMVNLSGQGDLFLSTKNTLSGTISGSGSIYYNSNYTPIITSNISGSGLIQSF